MNTCANVPKVTHIIGCNVYWKSVQLTEQTRFQMSQSCHLQAQGYYSLTEQSSHSLITLYDPCLEYCNTRVLQYIYC